MTGAMYAAISGLKSHMNKLNVIGNNIANVNTYGYKSGRTVFRSALYTTLQGGSNGTSTTGGVNPSQVGYGSSVASIDIDMSTGTYALTGKSTDCMIDGDGFFLVGSKDVAQTIYENPSADALTSLTLSRVGDFEFKADGYLTDGEGNVVYGFLCTGTDDTTGKDMVSDQLVPIRFPRMDSTGKILYPTEKDDGALEDDDGLGDDGTGDENAMAQFDSITIDGSTGKVSGVSKDTDQVVTIGYIAIGNVTNPNGVTQLSDSYYKAGDGSGKLSVSLLGGVAADLEDSAGAALSYLGGAGGDTDGKADLQILSAGTTTLITGGLEMSKTDLATEISEMITTQRGYQANTRIITVTDSMLEELVNMKR